ncbi:protein CUSTOS isoform X3 [Pelodiscus sinensis]|uniref:protein CUSTOS isoform X3 n=1 Tax=Pelodiscus sinensis TaxID=13735 RepID=UPI003F6A857E
MLCGPAKMAALRAGRGAGESESESSGAEDLARFREAAWELAGPGGGRAALGGPWERDLKSPPLSCKRWRPPRGGCKCGFGKDKLLKVQPSLRQKVNDHDNDGNELQTTPEFRAHVAKKLGAMLDSYITVLEESSDPARTSMQIADSADDDFRLFSSSVPGDCEKSKPPILARRRRPSSSSELDSDQEWQRCQEAAVSAADILKQSGLSMMPPDSSQVLKQECTEHKQKKKKKKKAKGEHISEQKTAGCGQISNQTLWSIDRDFKRQEGRCIEDTTLPRVGKKKKKKKKKVRKEVNDSTL